MDFTFELSKIYNVLPFEILKQDKDDVIMIINYMFERGEGGGAKSKNNKAAINKQPQQQMVKVNSKTATGGWW